MKLKQKILDQVIMDSEKIYNKYMLTAIAYISIGSTFIFNYFIDFGKFKLIFGFILILLSMVIYNKFK